MTAPLERPAGRPACGARPAGAPRRRLGDAAEYRRLRRLGVSHDAAVVLAWPPALGAAELAYWAALQSCRDPADVVTTIARPTRRPAHLTSRRSA